MCVLYLQYYQQSCATKESPHSLLGLFEASYLSHLQTILTPELSFSVCGDVFIETLRSETTLNQNISRSPTCQRVPEVRISGLAWEGQNQVEQEDIGSRQYRNSSITRFFCNKMMKHRNNVTSRNLKVRERLRQCGKALKSGSTRQQTPL